MTSAPSPSRATHRERRSGRPVESPIHVPDADLADLQRRLRRARLPEGPGTDDAGYGVAHRSIAPLVTHWATGFDWRAIEATINRYRHHRVDIDGAPVHFLHRRGVGPNPLPIILSHGWPWTFWHWSKVIEPLADPASHGGDPADAFDIILPSLPGFGFSTPVRRPDVSVRVIADMWHTLMTDVLGHERYGAVGCDLGALVSAQLGHEHADTVAAIHIGSGQKLTLFNGDRAWDVTGGRPLPDDLDPAARARAIELERRFAVHLAAQVLAPNTLAYAMTDSPVGLLAWLLERWCAWSDNRGNVEMVFTPDEILTHASIYWFTRSIGSSMRTYANNNRYPWVPSHDRWPVVEAPTGITLVGYENPPGVTTDQRVMDFLASDRAPWFRLVNVTAHDHGGHFIPWEIPAELVADIRRTFHSRR